MSTRKGCGKDCFACQVQRLRDLASRVKPNMNNESVGAVLGELNELIFNLQDIMEEQSFSRVSE